MALQAAKVREAQQRRRQRPYGWAPGWSQGLQQDCHQLLRDGVAKSQSRLQVCISASLRVHINCQHKMRRPVCEKFNLTAVGTGMALSRAAAALHEALPRVVGQACKSQQGLAIVLGGEGLQTIPVTSLQEHRSGGSARSHLHCVCLQELLHGAL